MYSWSDMYPDYEERMREISFTVKKYVNEDGWFHMELLPKE